tara:strand:+ start:2588 stop:2803 length:216 start_codon:yes stop_codon:yes gene_type:complete
VNKVTKEMKEQIAELQQKVSRLESKVEALLDRIRAVEVEKVSKDSLRRLRTENRDAFDRIADILGIERYKL